MTCPVCRKEKLTEVSWVFGEHLKQVSGSARTPDELTAMDGTHSEFSVYVVEVCRTCKWNQLIQSYVLGAPEVSRSRARRRTASAAGYTQGRGGPTDEPHMFSKRTQ